MNDDKPECTPENRAGKIPLQRLVTHLCGHSLVNNPEVTCEKDKGHKGCHSFCAEDRSPLMFTIYEWNDDGVGPVTQNEYCEAFQCDYDNGYDDRCKTMNLAIFSAKKTLPAGTIFEIRSKLSPSDCVSDFGRAKKSKREMAKNWGIAWYCVPSVIQPKGFEDYIDMSTDTHPLFKNDVDNGEENINGGYVLLARIEV